MASTYHKVIQHNRNVHIWVPPNNNYTQPRGVPSFVAPFVELQEGSPQRGANMAKYEPPVCEVGSIEPPQWRHANAPWPDY